MKMKKLIILLVIALLSSCAHREIYRLENIKVKTFRQEKKYIDGRFYFGAIYGVTDPKVTSIEDVVNRFTVTNWDKRRDQKDHVYLRKTIEKEGMVLDYTVTVYRPWNSPPWRIEAMGATDQGQYFEIDYLVLEKEAEKEDNSSFISKTDSEGNPMLIDQMTQGYLESKKPDPTQKSLSDMLSKIDRIRVVDAGMSGDQLVFSRDNASDKANIFLDTNSKEQIEALISCFRIIEDPKTFGHCMCLGWPTFEFLSGSKLIARIGLHHGMSIRWSEWKNDAHLSRNMDVLDWLAENGVPQPKEKYKADIARGEESRKKRERWFSAVPESILTQVKEDLNWGGYPFSTEDDINAIYETFTSSVPTESQALTLFKWYGSGCGLWSGYPEYEDLPKEMLMKIPTSFLLQALTNNLSDTHIEGVARFFTSIEFNQYRYPDRKLLPEDLKKRIREHIARQNDESKTNWVNAYLPK